MTFETALGVLSAFAAWFAVILMSWQIGDSRLAQFFAGGSDEEYKRGRKVIYDKYASRTVQNDKDRRNAIHECIKGDPDFKDLCDRQISYFERLATIAPRFPGLRKRTLLWFPHSAIFLRIILSPYIEQRRSITTRNCAHSFDRFMLSCIRKVRRDHQGLSGYPLRIRQVRLSLSLRMTDSGCWLYPCAKAKI